MWYVHALTLLAEGKHAFVTPHGNSMLPLIKSGETVELEPVLPEQLQIDDIVLCKVRGSVYLHLVTAIHDGRFMISNNKGHQNGWTNTIYGRCCSHGRNVGRSE